MTQPCTGRYYTKELIEKYVKQEMPYRKELIEMSIERFSVLANLQSNYYTVFTEAGIEQFVGAYTHNKKNICILGLLKTSCEHSIVGLIKLLYYASIHP